MNCHLPPELTDDELSSLIDGDADENLHHHIANCPFCAERLEQAKSLEYQLYSALHRIDCPSSLTLSDYQLKLIEDTTVINKIESHLEFCVRCQRELADWEAYNQSESEGFAHMNDIPETMMMPTADSKIVLFPTIVSASQRAVKGRNAPAVLATIDNTTIRLDVSQEEHTQNLLTLQVLSGDNDWEEGMVTIYQDGQLQSSGFLDEFLTYEQTLMDKGLVTVKMLSTDSVLMILENLNLFG